MFFQKGGNRMPQHSELTKSSTFQVFIGKQRLSFSKISGLGGGMPKEIYAEGGGVAAPHVMRTPKNNLRAVTFERGIQKNNATISKMKPGTFIPWIQILVLDNEKKLKCEYFLEEVWVTKWEVSGLDAMSNNVLIDTFEVEFVNLKKQIF